MRRIINNKRAQTPIVSTYYYLFAYASYAVYPIMPMTRRYRYSRTSTIRFLFFVHQVVMLLLDNDYFSISASSITGGGSLILVSEAWMHNNNNIMMMMIPNSRRRIRHNNRSNNNVHRFPCCQWRLLSRSQALNAKDDDGDGDDVDRRWEEVLKELDAKGKQDKGKVANNNTITGVNNNNNVNEDDDDFTIRSVGDLRQGIRQQGYQKTPQRSSNKAQETRDLLLSSFQQGDDEEEGDQRFLDGYDMEALEQVSKELLMDGGGGDDDDDDSSVFLDEDMYLQYSNLEMGTGLRDDYDGYSTRPPPSIISERQLKEFAMPPDAPYGSAISSDDNSNNNNNNYMEPTFDDILKLHRTMSQRKLPSPEEEKAIFEEIFKDETAYLEQTSSIFREGLTNKTAAEEATKMRRSSDYRKSLLNDLNRLEKQIQEFEVLLEQEEQKQGIRASDIPENEDLTYSSNSTEKTVVTQNEGVESTTSNDDDEEEEEEDLVNTDEPEEEWVLVDDPSTGEIFYWNSITGEMRMDPP